MESPSLLQAIASMGILARSRFMNSAAFHCRSHGTASWRPRALVPHTNVPLYVGIRVTLISSKRLHAWQGM